MMMVRKLMDRVEALARAGGESNPGSQDGVDGAQPQIDRGDVPGWVLITLMTAGLVAAIWAIAGPTLTNLFSSAIESVTGG